MFSLKRELEILLLIFIGGAIGVMGLTLYNSNFRYKIFPVVLPSASQQAPQVSPSPSLVPSSPKTTDEPSTSKTSSLNSPDGKKTLFLKEETKGQAKNYTLYVNDNYSNVITYVFFRKGNINHKISIPFNSWSIDDRYVLVKESELFFVWDTQSEDKALNVSDLFNEKYQNYSLEDVTGWAGPGLLIVNTNNLDGTLGPSLWFSLDTNSFVQLATRFN